MTKEFKKSDSGNFLCVSEIKTVTKEYDLNWLKGQRDRLESCIEKTKQELSDIEELISQAKSLGLGIDK